MAISSCAWIGASRKRLTSNPNVYIIRPDGTHKKDASGNDIRIPVPDSDSGIYLRGEGKSQVNIWNWPIGSGEVYGYRTDEKMPPAVRAGVTPSKHADQQHRRVEHLRNHDARKPADRRAQRRDRHQQCGAPGHQAGRADRAAAPRLEER